ncbi:MAG: hypothetical protein K9N23_19645 [Akkermansiaceae bacterium]|nr:hypothetical protein [Akkermansiaceae bacterium]
MHNDPFSILSAAKARLWRYLAIMSGAVVSVLATADRARSAPEDAGFAPVPLSSTTPETRVANPQTPTATPAASPAAAPETPGALMAIPIIPELAGIEGIGDLGGALPANPDETVTEAPPPADDGLAGWVTASDDPVVQPRGGGVDLVPVAPNGFTNGVPQYLVGGGAGGPILDGFSFSGNFSGTYDSNVTRSPGGVNSPVQDDFIFALGGTVAYMSTATDWTFGGSYTGSYNQYVEQTNYSGYNQSLSLLGNYDGARLSASLSCGIAYQQGPNRYYASNFVEQTSFRPALTLSYRYSPKTSIRGNIGYSFSTTNQNVYNDTTSLNLGLAALWKYSELTEFGPGVRYSYQSGGSSNSRTAISPEMLLNYRLTTKVRLNSTIGVDFASYENGRSADPSLTGAIGLNYQASEIWGLNLALYQGYQADTVNSNVFTEVSSVRLGYRQKIRRATLNLGASYEVDTYDNPTNSGINRPDGDYFSVDGSLGMAIFSNSTQASLFLRYSDRSGGINNDWDSVQTGLSLSRSF